MAQETSVATDMAAVMAYQRSIAGQIATLMDGCVHKTASDYDAGENPFVTDTDESRIWLRAALAQGPTVRVLALPDQARVRGESLGWLMEQTIVDPAWGSDDPAGRERFVAAVRAAYAQAADFAAAIRSFGSAATTTLIAAIPPACYDLLGISEADATAAVTVFPYDRPSPVLMARLLDRIRPSALRLLAEAYPAEPWSMRAFARLATLA